MTDLMVNGSDQRSVPTNMIGAVTEVFRVAIPLMISTGMFSLVLFADRTLLMFYDGVSMSASMAGGNLFWVTVCVPIGAASMTGAVIAQHIGNNEDQKVGRLLWQSVWLALLTIPWFAFAAMMAESVFQSFGQNQELVAGETIYMRYLMLGAPGLVIESALSGFFSGTQRTLVIMWVSVAGGLLNIVADVILIFGFLGSPELGIAGAAFASVISFWFKVACFAGLLLAPKFEQRYRIRAGLCFDARVMKHFVYFSFPSGLMFLTEAAAFSIIILKIGQLGDVPLRATTMAINFNIIAFIPLMGIAIAASVLVGRHLLESGPEVAVRTTIASLGISLAYSAIWAIAYLTVGDWMLALYSFGSPDGGSLQAISIAGKLLGFVAGYVLVDAVQLIVSAALKGAGDTWFVLGAGAIASILSISLGFAFDPGSESLHWWWWIITIWIWALAIAMSIRFLGGRWKSMRMV